MDTARLLLLGRRRDSSSSSRGEDVEKTSINISMINLSTQDASTLSVEEVSQHFPNASVLINPSLTEIRRAFDRPRRLIHICGHAGLDMVRGEFSWIDTRDGRLTSRDLTDMHMQAKTLVITGCQTARRMIQPGDEWLGLMRSFYLSGASTIVSALWDIRDQAARQFAREFYKVFNGHNALLAVQTAAAGVRRKHAHPCFWAGFGVFVRKEYL